MIAAPLQICVADRPLADLVEIERDGIDPSSIISGTKYVGLEHLDSDGQILKIQTVENGDLASTKFRFGPQHILYGKLRPYLCKIVRPDFIGVCSTDILPLLPKPNANRDYLYHMLRHPRLVQMATARCEGANLPRLNPKQLAEIPIPVPYPDDGERSLSEQKRIAAILDKADALRRKRRAIVQTIRNLLDAIFADMFGSIRARRSTYEFQSLRPFLAAASGRSSKEVLSSEPTGIPVYGGNGQNGWATRALYDAPVIVVGRVGQQCGITRMTAGPAWVTDNAIVVEVVDQSKVHADYLEAALQRSPLRSTVEYIDLPFINQSIILDQPLPLPPIEVQAEYARRKASHARLLAAAERIAASTEDLFNSLVQRAFLGEL